MIAIVISILPTLVCVVMAIQLAFDLYFENTRPRQRLLLFMVVSALLYMAHFCYFNHLTAVIPLTDSLYSFCNPAVYPLFFIFIEELTTHRPSLGRQLLYLLPSLLCGLTVAMLYTLMDADETVLFINSYLFRVDVDALADALISLPWLQAVAHSAVKVVFAIEVPVVLYFGWRHLSEFNQKVAGNFSATEGKDLTPFKVLLAVFGVTSILSFVSNLIGRHHFDGSIGLLALPSITFSLLLLLIGHIGMRQHFTAKELHEETDGEADMTAAQQPTARSHYQDLQTEIIRLLDVEKLYLIPNLKINDLAQKLHTNREYVYRAINIDMGQSFSYLINSKRIDYAASLIDKNPEILLTEVAVKAGFSSFSAFYRNWKQFRKCTPKEYLQQICND